MKNIYLYITPGYSLNIRGGQVTRLYSYATLYDEAI